MRKAVFIGKTQDFLLYLKTMQRWRSLSFSSIYHWTNSNQSYGAAIVGNNDLIREVV